MGPHMYQLTVIMSMPKRGNIFYQAETVAGQLLPIIKYKQSKSIG